MSEEHLSIGEVLAELHDEYPDITISKIRFLESQGLIDPERTPSGYRKFYPGDVERLRWILHQQKDNFLPLKVIRDRLAEAGGGVPVGAPADSPNPKPRKRPRKATKRSARRAANLEAPTLPLDDAAEDPPVGRRGPDTGASFTRDELRKAAGIDAEALAELESFGLVTPVAEGKRVLFDEEALVVARTAAAFAKHGIGARHLKMYKNFAAREAGMFEQVLLPHLRQRNPEATARAQDQLEELAKLGRAMRAAMLRRSIGRALGG